MPIYNQPFKLHQQNSLYNLYKNQVHMLGYFKQLCKIRTLAFISANKLLLSKETNVYIEYLRYLARFTSNNQRKNPYYAALLKS